MRYIYWIRSRPGRLFVILLATLTYFCLLTLDALNFFPHYVSDNGSYWLVWMRFSFSAYISLMFLAVGALVWLYARSRHLATLLLLVCLTLMMAFAVQTDSALADALPLLMVIGTVASSLAIYMFAILVLFFPKNTLPLLISSYRVEIGEERSRTAQQQYFSFILRGYLVVLTLLSIVSVLYHFFIYSLSSSIRSAFHNIDNVYDLLALSGILITMAITYRQSSSQREHQQLRLFASGVVLAVAPLLFLTVSPQALHFSPQYVVDAQLSTITLALLPLVLGYSILRYQFLVFDMYIRRAVAWIVGVVGLIILGYVVVTLSSLLFSKNTLAYTISLVVLMGLLAPCLWWFARAVTELIFFSEIRHHRRLIERPDTDILASETLDLNEASRLLTLAVVNAFETQEVCLYVLDEDTGYYRLCPALRDEKPDDIPRRAFVQRVLSNVRASDYINSDWLKGDATIIQRMTVAKRPLLLREAASADEELPTGLARYFTTTSTSLRNTEPILAPVRAQGKLIGLLLLGERGDHQQYAGSDFEAIYLLFSRFSPVLETARLYEKANRHAAILNTLYTGSTIDLSAFTSVEEVATAYTKVAAEAMAASAEIWLYCEKDKQLHCVARQGTGPHLAQGKTLLPVQVRDWTSWFYEGETLHTRQEVTTIVPPCLTQIPGFPFAWLPLQKGLQQIGMLVLTYARPHLFSHEEKRILAMFAVQCAEALENTRMTIELRAAYERQQELDLLKDQFIATASHELRTPLTAVQGYIELLANYDASLTPEIRADFVAKANRGCDELILMVGNIMDASHVQIDAQNVQLSRIPLAEPVQHVLEILEAMIKYENRVIEVDVAPDLYVMADHMRLRQVLLNLVSNALKYSPGGSSIEISATGDDKEISLRIRDYGAGVPLEDQKRLFERFVRLERDMNSTIRGAGLGLYISKQLVEAMGGCIWLESTGIPREGSTFAFTLRRASVNPGLLGPIPGQEKAVEI